MEEFPASIVEPTEMLRYLLNKIMNGRPLEITDITTAPTVKQTLSLWTDNIIQTTFEEMKEVEDPM